MKINNFGSKLKFEESRTSRLKRESEIFAGIIEKLEACWKRSEELYKQFGVGLIEYEEGYFSTIDDLLLLKYGAIKTEIILWYIYERIDPDGNIKNLILEFDNGEEDLEITLNTPKDLWDFLKRVKINGKKM